MEGDESAYQSLGFDPEKMTLVTTCPGPALGMGESMISTFAPLCIMASFIVLAWRNCEDNEESLLVADIWID